MTTPTPEAPLTALEKALGPKRPVPRSEYDDGWNDARDVALRAALARPSVPEADEGPVRVSHPTACAHNQGWFRDERDDTTWCMDCGRWRDDIMSSVPVVEGEADPRTEQEVWADRLRDSGWRVSDPSGTNPAYTFARKDDKPPVVEGEADAALARMVEVPLSDFHLRRVLTAANREVLWPMGLALTVEMDGNDYQRLYVTHWDYEDPTE